MWVLLDKQKQKQPIHKPEESQTPQAIPVVDSTEIQKKLGKQQRRLRKNAKAKALKEKMKQENIRKNKAAQTQKERRERSRCGCW